MPVEEKPKDQTIAQRQKGRVSNFCEFHVWLLFAGRWWEVARRESPGGSRDSLET